VLLHLGDRRILQWVLDRTGAAELIDQTVAAIGDRPENEAAFEYYKTV
jgi:spore coat polysaccharide biosynthesis protein SpsF (cytidylyltransferase family)